MAGTTFQERLNLCLFTISIDVLVTTMKLSRPVWVFVVVVEVEVVLLDWGNMRMQLSIRLWDGSMKKKTFKLILTILPNLSLYHFTYQSAETGTQDLLYFELFRMPKKNVLYSAM